MKTPTPRSLSAKEIQKVLDNNKRKWKEKDAKMKSKNPGSCTHNTFSMAGATASPKNRRK